MMITWITLKSFFLFLFHNDIIINNNELYILVVINLSTFNIMHDVISCIKNCETINSLLTISIDIAINV